MPGYTGFIPSAKAEDNVAALHSVSLILSFEGSKGFWDVSCGLLLLPRARWKQ